MKRLRVFQEEKGIAFPLFVVFLAALLFMLSFISDLGKVLIFRHEMQALADSLSLAGVSATDTIPLYSEGTISGFDIVLDPDLADREARSAYNQHWSIIQEHASKGKFVTNWQGEVQDSTKYHVQVWGDVETPLYASLMELLGQNRSQYETISVKVEAVTELKN